MRSHTELKIWMKMPWGWKASLGCLLFLSIVGFISQGIQIFSALRYFKSYQLSACHILHSSMDYSPHYCCSAEPSATCSQVTTDMPSCSSLIALYSQLSPQRCQSNVSACPPSIDDPQGWCDGGHACCGKLAFHRCYPHSKSVVYCRICYTDSLKIAYQDGKGNTLLVKLTKQFPTRGAGRKYLHRYRTNTTVRCFYNRHRSAHVILRRDLYSPVSLALLIISAFVMLVDILVFMRYGCIHRSGSKVCPQESFSSMVESDVWSVQL